MTGIVTKLIVYQHGQQVGRAFQVWAGPLNFPPILSTDEGKELEADWYTLEIISQHLAVVSMRIQ